MTRLPLKSELVEWIGDNPDLATLRDIAKAFGVKGGLRRDLKSLLREMEDEGLIPASEPYRGKPGLPPVTLIVATGVDEDGTLLARPANWRGDGDAPVIRVTGKGANAGPGDRMLARLSERGDGVEASVIKRLEPESRAILGIYRHTREGGRIEPVAKGSDRAWRVAAKDRGGAEDGELVEAVPAGPKRQGIPTARVTNRLGDPGAAKAVSLIAINEHGIPNAFSDEVLDEAAALDAPGLEDGREDLRHLPLITIDPSDARDHDDAVFAEPAEGGGHVIWVAIADVAHFVRPGTALDDAARDRGNSTYFADRVVPMLPDRLSGDLCSLHEGVDRACIALRMVIDAEGERIAHSFHRGLMRSRASLHYDEVQDAIDGAPNDRTAPHLDTVLRPIWSAWEALKRAKARRTPLALDLPEREIRLSDEGVVLAVGFKERRDAHRLIEDYMVTANAQVAEALLAARRPHVTRAHEEPDLKKLEALREVAAAAGFPLAKGQRITPERLNRMLAEAENGPHSEQLSLAVLRSMQQAYYVPENFGHFGLDLRAYVHFTSPIRRYADLIVHRAVYAHQGWGDWPVDPERLAKTAEHISRTERRSMEAERDTADRYLAAFLSDRIGATFAGRISGVQKFGLFVRLDETGADGLIPIRTLGDEYHRFDAETQTLEGADTGTIFEIGQRVEVRLVEASPLTGGLILELLEAGDGTGRKPRRRGPVRRRPDGKGKRAKPRRRGR